MKELNPKGHEPGIPSASARALAFSAEKNITTLCKFIKDSQNQNRYQRIVIIPYLKSINVK